MLLVISKFFIRVLCTEYLLLANCLEITIECRSRYPLGRCVTLHNGFHRQDVRQQIIIRLHPMLENKRGVMKILGCSNQSLRKKDPDLSASQLISFIHLIRQITLAPITTILLIC